MQNHASRRRSNHDRSAALLLSAAISFIGAHRAEATSFSATWANATNGTWSTATNWSTNPNFPNNGSPGGCRHIRRGHRCQRCSVYRHAKQQHHHQQPDVQRCQRHAEPDRRHV